MLSFTLIKSGTAIQVHCDDAGLSRLITALTKVRDSGHTHLWGPPLGADLNRESPFGDRAVQEVIITMGSMG